MRNAEGSVWEGAEAEDPGLWEGAVRSPPARGPARARGGAAAAAARAEHFARAALPDPVGDRARRAVHGAGAVGLRPGRPRVSHAAAAGLDGRGDRLPVPDLRGLSPGLAGARFRADGLGAADARGRERGLLAQPHAAAARARPGGPGGGGARLSGAAVYVPEPGLGRPGGRRDGLPD